ncbi:GNAT family N-acetyltransferase [Paenibacillus arenilitoris]|uniref:GNAT family N-acetyltransferase n=1 Tax=Paenibacillus arenilitoris TaxID=2772299 RepID=A0A927H4G1_9BACL|nr:GNAT family N-acetyltransferase [Paenibacillus arenilitoris]MBD2867347.1 GNAT family N-acetyltransferase [Paenibacillus arenilitoris]
MLMEPAAIRSFAELDSAGLEQAAEVFVDSYRKELEEVSRDRTVLARLIKQSFVKQQFYAAIQDGRVAGIMAYSTNKTRSQRFDRRELQQAAGRFKGWLLHGIFEKQFHAPLELGEDECYLEAVATDPAYRGKGIATALLNHLLEHLPYRVFTLEVVDTNVKAIRLYEKQGFSVFKSRKQRWFRRRLGFNERLYMRNRISR